MDPGGDVHHLWSFSLAGGNRCCLLERFDFVFVSFKHPLLSPVRVCYNVLDVNMRRSLFLFMLVSTLAEWLLAAGASDTALSSG